MLLTDYIPGHYREKAKTIAGAIDALDSVVVSAHVNLDGDALGSMVCAACLAQARGKEVFLYSSTGIPDFLAFFPLSAKLVTDITDFPFEPKSAFYVDFGDYRRIGGSFEEKAPLLPSINVDHHEGEGLGSLASWVEPKAAATTELMAYTALSMGLPLEGDLALAVALGLVTDTGGFSHANTSKEVFSLCALLTQNGCNIPALRESIDSNIRHERMRLWARLAPKIRFLKDGRIAYCLAGRSDFLETASKKEDLEGFVEYMLKLKGVQVSLLLREDEGARCKVSLRSRPGFDVFEMAKAMNGGGHRNAAGGTLFMTAEDAERHALSLVHDML